VCPLPLPISPQNIAYPRNMVSFFYIHNNQAGEEGKGKFFLFLLFLFYFILVLYSNFLFVSATSNQAGEEEKGTFHGAVEWGRNAHGDG
jgi:hypothetical protein